MTNHLQKKKKEKRWKTFIFNIATEAKPRRCMKSCCNREKSRSTSISTQALKSWIFFIVQSSNGRGLQIPLAIEKITGLQILLREAMNFDRALCFSKLHSCWNKVLSLGKDPQNS